MSTKDIPSSPNFVKAFQESNGREGMRLTTLNMIFIVRYTKYEHYTKYH